MYNYSTLLIAQCLFIKYQIIISIIDVLEYFSNKHLKCFVPIE